MDVFLPINFERSTMYKLIEQVIDRDFQPKSKEIVFDFFALSFIEPVGITVLSNLIEWLFKRDVSVFFRSPKRNFLKNKTCPISYLDDSLFFKRYVGETKFHLASIRPTTIPLELVSYSDSYQWLDKTMAWLASKINTSILSLGNIKNCLQEVFNNINDHSKENIGCVFAQYYPRNNEIKVAISDFGVGIPQNIQKVFPNLTDADAILKATEQGFSTKSSPSNRGAGLDTLIYNVVNNNQGRVYIHSNHGILNCTYNNSRQSLVPENTSGFYPGTLLEIVFRTDTIENILVSEEEFEW